MSVESGIFRSVMKAIYNLCDEDNYNVYDSSDIAEYLGLKESLIEEVIQVLEEARMIAECMNLHDDGIQTYHLTDKAIDLVEMG